MYTPDFVLGRLVIRVVADATQYHAAMHGVRSSFATFLNQVGFLGAQITRLVTLPLAIVGATSVRAFARFDQAMTHTTAVLQGTSAEMRRQMEDMAFSISSRSITSPREIAEGYYYLATAGYDAARAMRVVADVERFAVAGRMGMARATDLLVGTQNALALSSDNDAVHLENLRRVMNVTTAAGIMALGTVEEMAEALSNRAAGALRMANKEIEEGAAILAVYAQQNIRGREAGTRLYIMLRDLQASSIRNADAWQRYGMTITNTKFGVTNLLPVADILQQLEDRMHNLNAVQRQAFLMRLGMPLRSAAAILPLLGQEQIDQLREYEQALRNVGGVVEGVANRQLQSFSAQMMIFWNRITIAGIAIGRILAPWIAKLSDVVMSGIYWFQKLPPIWKEIVVLGGALALAIGPILAISSHLVGVLIRMIPLLISLGFVLGGSVLTAAILVAINLFSVRDAMGQVGELVRSSIRWWQDLDRSVKANIYTFAAIGASILALKAIFTMVYGVVAPLVVALLSTVGMLFTPIGVVLAGLTAIFLITSQTGLRNAFNEIKTGLMGILGTVRQTFGGIRDAIAAGDIQLAMEIASVGIQIIWERLIMTMRAAWRGFAVGWKQDILGLFSWLLNLSEPMWRSIGQGDAFDQFRRNVDRQLQGGDVLDAMERQREQGAQLRRVTGMVEGLIRTGTSLEEAGRIEGFRRLMADHAGEGRPAMFRMVETMYTAHRARLDAMGLENARLIDLQAAMGPTSPQWFRDMYQRAERQHQVGLNPEMARIFPLEDRLAALTAQAGRRSSGVSPLLDRVVGALGILPGAMGPLAGMGILSPHMGFVAPEIPRIRPGQRPWEDLEDMIPQAGEDQPGRFQEFSATRYMLQGLATTAPPRVQHVRADRMEQQLDQIIQQGNNGKPMIRRR